MKDFLFDYGERNPVPLQHRSWGEEGKGRRSLRLKREDQLNLDEIWLSVSNPIRKPSDICVNAVWIGCCIAAYFLKDGNLVKQLPTSKNWRTCRFSEEHSPKCISVKVIRIRGEAWLDEQGLGYFYNLFNIRVPAHFPRFMMQVTKPAQSLSGKKSGIFSARVTKSQSLRELWMGYYSLEMASEPLPKILLISGKIIWECWLSRTRWESSTTWRICKAKKFWWKNGCLLFLLGMIQKAVCSKCAS